MNTAVLAEEIQTAGARRVTVAYNDRTHVLTVEAETPTVVTVAAELGAYLAPLWPYSILRYRVSKTGLSMCRARWVVRIGPEG